MAETVPEKPDQAMSDQIQEQLGENWRPLLEIFGIEERLIEKLPQIINTGRKDQVEALILACQETGCNYQPQQEGETDEHYDLRISRTDLLLIEITRIYLDINVKLGWYSSGPSSWMNNTSTGHYTSKRFDHITTGHSATRPIR